MGVRGRLRGSAAAAAAAVAVLGLAAGSGDVAGKSAGGKGQPSRNCGSFANQAAAQDYFFKRGGSPRRKIGGLDPDGNGVACERLDAPHKGYADVAFESRRGFFYGGIAVPAGTDGDFPCLYKNAKVGITRRVLVYKARRGKPDLPLTLRGGESRESDDGSKGTVQSGAGRLTWKVDPSGRIRGRFYVDVPQSETESGSDEDCPRFRSRAIRVR